MIDAHLADSLGNVKETLGNVKETSLTSTAPLASVELSQAGKYSEATAWSQFTHRHRCRMVARTAAEIAGAADRLVEHCQSEQRTEAVETIASELVPLADALAWLGKHGPRVLADKRLSRWHRPWWLWGVRSHVRRDPWGRVLILGTWNYPILLSGTQAAQALAAGNTVLLKPAPGSEAASAELVECFFRAGVPRHCLTLLDSSVESAKSAIDKGVDLVVLTGGAPTGRAVLAQAAKSLTPCVMELSGSDAVVVLEGADWDRVGRAVRFGLSFNAGATCIGPRRLIVPRATADDLVREITGPWASDACPTMTVHPAVCESLASVVERAIANGAVDVLGRFDVSRLRATGRMSPMVLDHVAPSDDVANSDLFAPVMCVLRVDDVDSSAGHDHIARIVNDCPYRLAASVFGRSTPALQLAKRLRVGSVVINDLIAPTADPRLPFGGRGQSGFGVTRGCEGLLAMTVPTPVSERRNRFALHLMKRRDSDAETLLGSLQLQHARGLRSKMAGLRRLIAAVKTGKG